MVAGCGDERTFGPQGQLTPPFAGWQDASVGAGDSHLVGEDSGYAPEDVTQEDSGPLEWPEFAPAHNALSGIRYVRVITTDSPSWVSWFEVEVSGTWPQMGGEPFNLALGRPVEVDGSTDEEPASHLVDGDHGTLWNAGIYPPAALTVDLLMEAEIHEIRLRVSQDQEGTTEHEVQVAGPDGAFVPAHVFAGLTVDGQWLKWSPEADTPDEEDETIEAKPAY